MVVGAMRRVLVDSPTSLGAKARLKRWQLFRATFPRIEEMRILDLGGTVDTWQRAPVRPRHVTVLNLFEPDKADGGAPAEDWAVPVVGDACRAADDLARANIDGPFDLVFSNSLIEHVGGHARRAELAEQVHALAPRHWIQTPYRYFPLEPHWLFPGMQHLPAATRVAIARHWPLVHTKPENIDQARSEVLWTELIGITEMKDYFPTSTIARERIMGLTKSIIAIKS